MSTSYRHIPYTKSTYINLLREITPARYWLTALPDDYVVKFFVLESHYFQRHHSFFHLRKTFCFITTAPIYCIRNVAFAQ